MKVFIIGTLLALSGCALTPERINAEYQHVSHISQHFGPDKTNYGYNSLGIDAHWQYKRVGLDIDEGAVLEACQYNWCGSMGGKNREIFNARIDVALWKTN